MNTQQEKEEVRMYMINKFLTAPDVSESRKSALIKNFKERFKTFGETRAAIRNGEYDWVFLAP